MATEIAGEGTSIPTVQSVPMWKRFDALEVALLGCLGWLLPDTWISQILKRGFWFVFNNLGVSQQMGEDLFYVVGLLLLVCLLIRYLSMRFVLRTLPPTSAHFADAISLFSLLYLLDFFLSTADPFDYGERAWPFFALAPFFVVILYLNRTQTMRLVRVLAITTGVQALYAIYFYITAQHQFYTPHFGNRTGGTFENPNVLYPLCLLGAPLCLALYEAQSGRWMRVLFAVAAVANLVALSFTYMRSGWLGLAAALLFLLISRRSPWSVHPKLRKLGIGLLICTLLAVLFLRTRGDVIGNSHDRSTLGRLQIWRVSLHVIARHPWLGSGLSTYEAMQSNQMTPDLQAFNPLNPEAKSLFLNTTAEFGLLGLGLLLLSIGSYLPCYRSAIKATEQHPESAAVVVGATAGVIAIVVAGLFDTPVLHWFRAPDTFALMLLLGAVTALNTSEITSTPKEPRSKSGPPKRLRLLRGVRVCLGILSLLVCGIGAVACERRLHNLVQPYEQSGPRGTGEVTIPLSGISASMQDATLAMEDKHFYEHHGFDLEALHRALRKDIRAHRMVQGGSTITQQLAKNLFLTNEKTVIRKLQEAALTLELEHRLSKQHILELYLNVVDYGMGQHGITAASHYYFNKPPAQLTPAESALLVGLAPHPPKNQLNPAQLMAGQQTALQRMRTLWPDRYPDNMITSEQSSALALRLAHLNSPIREGNGTVGNEGK